jgi:hypothetical protein
VLAGPQLIDKCFKGAYFWPRFGMGSLHVQVQTTALSGPMETTTLLWAVAGTGGYQWRWQWFSLRLGAGVLYVGQVEPNSQTPKDPGGLASVAGFCSRSGLLTTPLVREICQDAWSAWVVALDKAPYPTELFTNASIASTTPSKTWS